MKKDTPYTGPTYTIAPNKADDDLLIKGHTNSEFRVYFNLCRHYNRECNQSWPSIGTISNETGIDKRSVSRALKQLALSGMILITKSKNKMSVYENNVYYLPHAITLQIEQLVDDRKNLRKNKKRIFDLKELKEYVLQAITEFIGRGNNPLRRGKNPLREGNIVDGRGKNDSAVGGITPTNNTTINSTNNITINVAKDNDDETSDLTQVKKHTRSLSLSTPQHIGKIPSLVNLKNEGLAQEIAAVLDDHKSIPFFRNLVSKFISHEDVIHKCLSLTRETKEITGIKKTKGAVFTDHIKREGLKLGIEV